MNASCSLDEVVCTSRVVARYRPVIGTNKAKVCVLVFPSDVASCIAFLFVKRNMERSPQQAFGIPALPSSVAGPSQRQLAGNGTLAGAKTASMAFSISIS